MTDSTASAPDASLPLTLAFEAIGPADLPRVGGKGANLGTLTRAGVRVPPGFCVTTAAYDRFVAALPTPEEQFAPLDALDGSDAAAAQRAAASMRRALEALPMPGDVAAAIVSAWRELGPERPLAVRSSATAEDLPGASFAGQQDTFLNVKGEAELLHAVRRCWISLFTDRAVLYRARNAFGQRAVRLAVVVQRLVEPDASGILFTADPVSGNRYVASIDAGFGLGEALVGGLIDADLYRVDRRRGTVVLARPGDKAFAIRSAETGGTRREPLTADERRRRVLTDPEVLELAALGDRIERTYRGVPQDIEWCRAGGELFVVQARPITSLYPVPHLTAPAEPLRVFFSFGHLQMMLDPMPRLAIETWRLLLPVGKGTVPTLQDQPRLSAVVLPAAAHLFLDVTAALRIPRVRRLALRALRVMYPDLSDALDATTRRPEFAAGGSSARRFLRGAIALLGPVARRIPTWLLVRDPRTAALEFDEAVQRLPDESAARIRSFESPAARLRQSEVELNAMFGRVRTYVAPLVAGLIAYTLLKRSARGEWAAAVRDDVDLLLRGLPGNVTTVMDLAVGDLTDRARSHPALAAVMEPGSWASTRAALAAADGGPDFLAALGEFLTRYGDRGAGEIDVSRPRWRDDPSLLLRVIAGGLSAADRSAHRRQYDAQVEAGRAAAGRLVAAARRGSAGPLRGWWVRRLANVARTGLGLREHLKFTIVRLLGVVHAEVGAIGSQLAARGQLAAPDEVWHFGFDELASALDDAGRDLRDQARERDSELRRNRSRKPPIVMASDGEIPTVRIDRADLPAGALQGTGASAGVVEGIARVITDPDREVLRAGEILVAPFTDPGWTPLFVHAAGVVTEVGGLMTHGAVVAREYGIPAVVSVPAAVERIRTGQRIRVDGTRGYVQLLDAQPIDAARSGGTDPASTAPASRTAP